MTPACLQEAIVAIDGFADLVFNWDGLGAYPITPAAIAAAKAFLRSPNACADFELEWEPSPLEGGGIALKAERGCLDVELTIFANGALGVSLTTDLFDGEPMREMLEPLLRVRT